MLKILQERKENIYLSNRKVEKDSRLKEARRTIIKSLDMQLLALVRRSQIELNQQVLDQLIEHANLDQSNAILQLGNLIIDNSALVGYIAERMEPLSNDSWWWLIRVLAYAGYINQNLLSLLTIKLAKKNSTNTSLANVLETFAQLTNKPELCSHIIESNEPIISVSTHMDSNLEELCKPAFKIFLNLVANNEWETQRVLDLVGPNKISALMRIGLLKADIEIRLDTCQALTNICLNNFITEDIIPLITVRSQSDKPRVVKELSYYIINIAQYATIPQLNLFFQSNLIETLFTYAISENQTLINNCVKFIQTVMKRLQENNLEELQWNFVRMLRDSNVLRQLGKCLEVGGDSMEIIRIILQEKLPQQ